MPVTLKPILPKPFNKAALKVLRQPVERTIDEAAALFEKTQATWEHKAKFKKTVKETAAKIDGSVLTSGDGSKEHPYPFVTRGTKVRRALMTPGFVAKSQKRIIGSGQGQGGVLFVSKRLSLPGIKAREFEEEIGEQMEPRLKAYAEDALSDFAKKSGHAL